jgi:hypothetical protein
MARIKNFLTPQWLKEFEELKRQAASSKRQAPSVKLQAHKKNPGKIQAPSAKHQASSRPVLDP